jgi:hypothetical protein
MWEQSTWEGPLRDGRRFKVGLPRNLGTCICPLVHHKAGDGGIVIPTLWNEGEEEAA